jgi:carbonic anhydrase
MIKATLALLVATLLLGNSELHWDYDKHGPEHWGEFSQTCEKGKQQSPINIKTTDTHSLQSMYTLISDEDRHTTATVTDNGHGIKITPKEGGKITVHGVEYKLLQFHFHGKSENTVNDVHFDLEMHMVHQNPEGQLAVVGVMFLEGDNNPVLDNILGNVGETIRIDPADVLPKDTSKYYHWVGSLTTPPCSENVQWYLMKDTLSASKDQIEAFRKYYDHNYRPTQPLNGRTVEVK